MDAAFDHFDKFLLKVNPLLGSLYQSVEFACVAARSGVDWVVVSGKAVLSPSSSGTNPQISELVRFAELIALSGRVRVDAINNLILTLRNSWVIETVQSEKIQLLPRDGGRYNWTGPEIYAVEGSRWTRAFWVDGNGPDVSALVPYELDGKLRHGTSFKGIDGLCRNLGLPARRGNLASSFRIAAELPATFNDIQTDGAKRALEIDIECAVEPDLMIEWLPNHYLEKVPRPWRPSRRAGDFYHASVQVRDGAKSAELRLAFGDLEPVDIRTFEIFGEREVLVERLQGVQSGAHAPAKRREPIFETAFHTYVPAGQEGEGGAGTVFKARDEEGRVLAIKRLDPDKTTSERLKRFENELNFCKRQSHRNVITVLDEGFTAVGPKKAPFYVMPFYPKTLRRLMAGGIPSEQVLLYFAQVLDGVEAAHLQKVWHRDLKPENILCDPDAGTLVVADFGIAHFEEDDLYTAVDTRDGARLANFQYAAPEQKTRGKKVDHRADIFALGLLLNEMFTHEVLQGEGYRRIASVAPRLGYLDEIVALMVQQESDKRPASIDALKTLMHSRGDEYLSRQKLSTLRKAVIPSSQIDDPLIDDPVRIVQAGYRDGKIIFTLSQPVNQLWTRAFQSQTVQQYWSGLSPQDFLINGDIAEVRADEGKAQHARDHLERYLREATANYKRTLEQSIGKREESERRVLQDQIREEEQRQRILGILNPKR